MVGMLGTKIEDRVFEEADMVLIPDLGEHYQNVKGCTSMVVRWDTLGLVIDVTDRDNKMDTIVVHKELTKLLKIVLKDEDNE